MNGTVNKFKLILFIFININSSMYLRKCLEIFVNFYGWWQMTLWNSVLNQSLNQFEPIYENESNSIFNICRHFGFRNEFMVVYILTKSEWWCKRVIKETDLCKYIYKSYTIFPLFISKPLLKILMLLHLIFLYSIYRPTSSGKPVPACAVWWTVDIKTATLKTLQYLYVF